MAQASRLVGTWFQVYRHTAILERGAFLFFLRLVMYFILTLLSRSLPVVTEIRGHVAASPTPLPTTLRAFILSRQGFTSAFSATHRLASNCPDEGCTACMYFWRKE